MAAIYADDRKEVGETIDLAKREGLFAEDLPTPWLIEAYDNLIYAAWSLVRTGEATPKQAADFVWRTLTTGLKGENE